MFILRTSRSYNMHFNVGKKMYNPCKVSCFMMNVLIFISQVTLHFLWPPGEESTNLSSGNFDE